MKLKHWIRIIIFVALSALLVLGSSTLLSVANEKDAVGLYGFFKEPKDSLDVVLIGPSTIYTAFYPPQAYEEQGITSYSLSTSTMPASLYRYAAELAVEEQHPQLLIIETSSFGYEDQWDETSLRKFLDSMPDSELKHRAVRDLVPEDLRSSFTYPFQKYHASWDRFGELVQVLRDKIDMNRQGYSYTKNFATTPHCQEFKRQTGEYPVSETGLEQLQILLDYLKEAGAEHVLFIRTLEMGGYESTETYHQMIDMIRGAGYDFLNTNAAAEDIGLDPTHDFYNFSHLNIYGAEKFTSFLADHIVHRYQLRTEHTDAVTAEWEDCASYNEEVLLYLKTLTDEDAGGFLYTQRDFINGR